MIGKVLSNFTFQPKLFFQSCFWECNIELDGVFVEDGISKLPSMIWGSLFTDGDYDEDGVDEDGDVDDKMFSYSYSYV